jgi:hypothetical protein
MEKGSFSSKGNAARQYWLPKSPYMSFAERRELDSKAQSLNDSLLRTSW